MMHNFLLIATLLAQLAAAPHPPPMKPPDTAGITSRARIHTWGGLFSVTIPSSCKHSYRMPADGAHATDAGVEQKKTCRVYLKFSGIPVLPTDRYRFRTWDEASDDDSLHRIFLTDASWRGIYVQGVCGHRVFVEVTYQ